MNGLRSNHPCIAAIYGLDNSGETHALVIELVEGPTLADRIRQGPPGGFAVLNGRQGDHAVYFDGSHLRIRFANTTELRPFDLNITFHTTGREWTGTWRFGGKTREVVLSRPRPAGVCGSRFCGDWKGEPNPEGRFPFMPGELHIRESSDGVFTVWLDRRMSVSQQADERDGERLRVISLAKNAIVLKRVSAVGPTVRYSGKLTFDHLEGRWGTGNGEGFQAPSFFVRLP